MWSLYTVATVEVSDISEISLSAVNEMEPDNCFESKIFSFFTYVYQYIFASSWYSCVIPGGSNT